jgi:mRNA-degrading endonuclease toxin of MazEF toxin-antitoxin module
MTAENGLKLDSYVMLDKLVAVARKQLNKRIGEISSEKLHEVYAGIIDFLGA